MNPFRRWYKSYKSEWNIQNQKIEEKEAEIRKREIKFKKKLIKNKKSYEKKIEEETVKGNTRTSNIEPQCHVMGVHYDDIIRMSSETYEKELQKRHESTLNCLALQRMVKDINRHCDFPVKLIYNGEIDYCNRVDNSVVDCKVFFDWSLKNNLKLAKDKLVGKII